MLPDNIENGDLVSHVIFPKTVGIYIERLEVPSISPICEIFWLKHPDIEMYGHHQIVDEKVLKLFKPWRGFYPKTQGS